MVKPRRKHIPPRPSLLPDTDCEDQGFSRIEDGCLACLPSFPDGCTPVYPALEQRNVNGRLQWHCPNGHGSFGFVRAGDEGASRG